MGLDYSLDSGENLMSETVKARRERINTIYSYLYDKLTFRLESTMSNYKFSADDIIAIQLIVCTPPGVWTYCIQVGVY